MAFIQNADRADLIEIVELVKQNLNEFDCTELGESIIK